MTATTNPPRWPAKAGDYPGCSDGGCVFGHPGGMHTNGGCHCLESMRDPHDRVKVRDAIRRLLRAAAEPEGPKPTARFCCHWGCGQRATHGPEEATLCWQHAGDFPERTP